MVLVGWGGALPVGKKNRLSFWRDRGEDVDSATSHQEAASINSIWYEFVRRYVPHHPAPRELW